VIRFLQQGGLKQKEEQLYVALREKQAQIDALKKKVKYLEREKEKLPILQNLQFVNIEVSQYLKFGMNIKQVMYYKV